MIGDSPGDMDAAAAAGAYRIGVRADSGDAPAGAQALVAALDEIELAP
jgi:phosphoglycolate phosphatase-like HAD superfamily hydrolase